MRAPKRTLPSDLLQADRLPKNQVALATLLRAVEKLLDFLEPTQHGQEMRLDRLRKTLRRPQHILKQREFLAQVHQHSQKRFAEGGPSVSALEPYVDTPGFHRLFEELRVAKAGMDATRHARPTKVQDWKPQIDAIARFVAAEGAVVRAFRELQRQILSALDHAGEDSADRKADKQESLPIRLPQNPDVTELARRISERTDKHRSQREIAFELTDGNERLAQNLLRQLRRFPHLVDRRRK